MEQENNKNKADENAAEDLVKSQSSEKKGPNSLKAKSDIAKSMAKNFMKTRKATTTSEVQRGKGKKKKKAVSEGSKEAGENGKRLNLREENQQKKDATTSTELVEKSKQIQENPEITRVSDSQEKRDKPNDSTKKRRREEEPGVPNKNQKNEEKQKGKEKIKHNMQKEQHSNSKKNKKERHGTEKKQENRIKEKIDGLIFMCNAKTKPDCFRYRVMGVSSNKKDLVLGIRRGLKLFLYDYELKLMYGIYKASSSGGMKLEPKAFGGAFPAQVRFSVHADCFPLAESIFKKAIKENYNEKNKFKTELTARQVRKLTELFKPARFQPTALPIHSPSRAVARVCEQPENREARPPSDREASARDRYANIGARSYAVLSQERDQQIAYGELGSSWREDSRHLYLSEKEYRAYGLRTERRKLNLQHHTAPTLLSSYRRDLREQLPRQPDTLYRESASLQRDIICSDPRYLTERGYRTYDLGATREMQSTVTAATANTTLPAASTLDSYGLTPHHSRYGASPVDSYLPRLRGERRLIETDHLRRERNQIDKSYSPYVSDALADYNQIRHHPNVKPEAASASVSTRYSFAGASLSYR